jgi:hypothetical protein
MLAIDRDRLTAHDIASELCRTPDPRTYPEKRLVALNSRRVYELLSPQLHSGTPQS